jgi:hypothetical protein
MGSATQAGGYRGALIVLAIASALFVLGLVFKERIEGWVEGLLHRGKGGKDGQDGPGQAGVSGGQGPSGEK